VNYISTKKHVTPSLYIYMSQVKPLEYSTHHKRNLGTSSYSWLRCVVIGADVGGLDPVCTAAEGGPSAVSGPAVNEGDRIWIRLWLRLGFEKV
jgi:hypothetical protein